MVISFVFFVTFYTLEPLVIVEVMCFIRKPSQMKHVKGNSLGMIAISLNNIKRMRNYFQILRGIFSHLFFLKSSSCFFSNRF